MTCPYSESNCTFDIATDSRRCLCGGYLKHCTACGTRSRAFANYCRECSASLPPASANWLGYRGGTQRTGASDASLEPGCVTRATGLRLRLGDTCRSLLGYDGHVIAISVNGIVEIADPVRAKSVCRFQSPGPITAEACVANGNLYVATRGQVSAYALAAMSLETPRVRPLWQVTLGGTPIQALTPAGDRLYVTLASAEWREVHVIEQQRARLVHAAPKVSWIASDETRARAVFLSEDAGEVRLNLAGAELTSHRVSLISLRDHPIALLGDTLFAVFGDSQRLYRIDVTNGDVEEPLDDDTQFFALTHSGDEWDRDSVRIDSGGIHFSRGMIRDAFAPHERASRGSPVVVQDCAVAVGMEDGRVLIYDLAALPHHEIWRVSENSDIPITAVASFDTFIAAGNKDGIVEVRELVAARSLS